LADSAIDLSAIAKGYGVDAVARLLELHELNDYLVEVGGELRAHGKKPDGSPWRIAIETPSVDARQIYQVVKVNNMAVATSGNYRNYYEQDGTRYSHTLDPSTLRPVTHNLASVTVVDASAARADALATALMVMGDEQGVAWATRHQVPAYFIMKQDQGFVAQATAGFKDYLEN
ncbi:MAG: FAD:protein FMN transferase, partial [Pseudomonadales bacterium]|nr:FAD:protein FMN transferase [Pseudomonadales bacterium]